MGGVIGMDKACLLLLWSARAEQAAPGSHVGLTDTGLTAARLCPRYQRALSASGAHAPISRARLDSIIVGAGGDLRQPLVQSPCLKSEKAGEIVGLAIALPSHLVTEPDLESGLFPATCLALSIIASFGGFFCSLGLVATHCDG